MPNTHKKPNTDVDDKDEAGNSGPVRKNDDKTSGGGSQSDNRGSGSRGKGKSSGSNRSSN